MQNKQRARLIKSQTASTDEPIKPTNYGSGTLTSSNKQLHTFPPEILPGSPARPKPPRKIIGNRFASRMSIHMNYKYKDTEVCFRGEKET